MTQLLGPFSQIVTMDGLAAKGPLDDNALTVIPEGAIRIANGVITAVGRFQTLRADGDTIVEVPSPAVAVPGFIDAHTHMCFAGSRAADYAKRLRGISYQQIAAEGGGILDTVRATRKAAATELKDLLLARLANQRRHGVTTCEIKSGYGLSVEEELKMLRVIRDVAASQPVRIVPTCLAAHVRPPEYTSSRDYLQAIADNLFPLLKKEKLTNRVDIFVEEGAFSIDEARSYLKHAKDAGFSICLHADQFSRGGAQLAAELHALSADHLEMSTSEDFRRLYDSEVIPIVLPGASLGLGIPFPPARALLDHGLPLVIASDYNPGSAPMGNLLAQAALLGAAQHLTMAETLAAITCRAARALELSDVGIIKLGFRADLAIFPCSNYQEILYHQGMLLPI